MLMEKTLHPSLAVILDCFITNSSGIVVFKECVITKWCDEWKPCEEFTKLDSYIIVIFFLF